MDEGQLPGGRIPSGRMTGNAGQIGRGNEHDGSSMSGASTPSHPHTHIYTTPTAAALPNVLLKHDTPPPIPYIPVIHPSLRPRTIPRTDHLPTFRASHL